MRIATVELESISPYSQSRYYEVPKEQRPGGTVTETHAEYEERTWRERCHVDETGEIFIPPMAFKNCLTMIAKYLSIKIPGKRNATYTKHFTSGVMVVDPVPIGIKKADVEGERLFVPADGVRGSGKRVMKVFPLIRGWKASVVFHVLDEVISQDVFEQHLEDAGNFIGIGRFNPAHNGYYGRFKVNKIAWA